MRDRRLLKALGAFSLFALGSAWVTAQGPGSGAALIPYQGHLELHGVPVDGDIDVRIGLFQDDAAANAACLATPASCGLWADTFTDVPVHNGSFSLMLGSQAGLNDNLFEYDTLYVGLAVAEADGTLVALGGLQRLASVPYAVRTERSPDLYVSGAIGVGTESPTAAVDVVGGTVRVQSSTNSPSTSIGQFYSNNSAQGVGIAYDGIAAIGNNVDQNLRLAPKGNGVVDVQGPLLDRAVRNENGVETLYSRDSGRYLVRATYQAGNNTRRYVPISEDVLVDYCGDEDGCTVRIGMRNFSAGVTISSSMGPFAFFYGSSRTNGTQRQWRRAETLATTSGGQQVFGAVGTDGDGVPAPVVRDFDCHFTDGEYGVGSGVGTDGLGMGLLNFNNASSYTPDCWLTLDD